MIELTQEDRVLLDKLKAEQVRDIDLHGRAIINARDSINNRDYVTREEMIAYVAKKIAEIP